MKILVAGGAGFIGSVAVRELSRSGFTPVVLDSFETGHPQAVRGFEAVNGDLRRDEDLRRVFRNHRLDGAVYLAGVPSLEGEDPRLAADPHARYLRHLGAVLDLGRLLREYGIAPLVLASTLEVYGGAAAGPVGGPRGPAPNPRDATGRIALAIEHFLLDNLAAGALRPVILRFGWVAGADLEHKLGDDRPRPLHWLGKSIRAAGGGGKMRLLAGEDSRRRPQHLLPAEEIEFAREVLHVRDAAAAVSAGLRAAIEGRCGVFDLGTGQPRSPAEIRDGLRRLGVREPPEIPLEIGPEAPRMLAVDPEAACRKLEWSPERSDLKTVLRDALRWRAAFPEGYRSADALVAEAEAVQPELFGEVAIRLGFVSARDVIRALDIQRMRAERGLEHKLIGLVMLEEGMLTSSQLIEVLRYYESRQKERHEEERLQI